MALEFNGNFAKLVPCNHTAQVLFSTTYVHVKTSEAFHLRFMERTDGNMPSAEDEPVESSTDYDTHPDTDTEDPRVEVIQNPGHFLLSFNGGIRPEIPHFGWKAGRGTSKIPKTRNVDLLLATPGNVLGKSLASVHMVFRFNRLSGLLMLRGGSQKASVEFRIDGVWHKLGFQEEQLMYQRATMLRAGKCEYELEYTIEEKFRETYFRQREKFLGEVYPSQKAYTRAFKRLPGDSSVLRGRYLEFDTRGSGTFGWITEGLDTKTGNPIAIKEIRIARPKDRSNVTAEVKMGTQFVDKRGLTPILHAACEHGHPVPCRDLERFYMYMPYASSDFSVGFWNDPEILRTTKLHWLKEPLEGLGTLHAMGIMHRDVRPANTLILSSNPPRAALCDFGKAIEVQSSTDTLIGPIHTLAPEVWTAKPSNPYTAKIDTWAYGYAIANILGYSTSGNHPITPTRHSTILGRLRAHSQMSSEDEPLVDLVSKLLKWDPKERWSAEQALQHRCWDEIVQEGREDSAEAESSNTKRTRLSE